VFVLRDDTRFYFGIRASSFRLIPVRATFPSPLILTFPMRLLCCISVWSGLVAALLLTGTASAQTIGPATDYVQWEVTASPAKVPAGGTLRLVWKVQIDDGWKMYALDSPPPSRGVRVRLEALPEGVTQEGAFRQTPPKEGHDPNFGVNVRYFEHAATLEATFKVSTAAGPKVLGGQVEFMICNDRLCLPPTRVPFQAAFTVQAAAATSEDTPSGAADVPCDDPAALQAPPDPEGDCEGDAAALDALMADVLGDRASGSPKSGQNVPPQAVEVTNGSVQAAEDSTASASTLLRDSIQAASVNPTTPLEGPTTVSATSDLAAATAGGFWRFLLLAMGAGLLALLTPCVFPMIPLTVSYFTRHAASRREAVRMAGVYGLSIVGTFTGLGVLMAVLVGAAGAQTIAANPWVNLLLALVLLFFGLSLLGLFELRLPAALVNYTNRQGNERKGYAGVLFMGLTLTLVSFSCTAPFVGGLLAAAAGGSWQWPLVGMVAFSTLFALPFVVLALFPNLLHRLPKSGQWMNALKVTLGFIEVAAALKFFSNADLVWGWGLVSRPLAIAATVVLFFLAGLYLLGKLRLAHDDVPAAIGVGRLLAATAFIALALYLLPGLLGAPLGTLDAWLPPRQGTDVGLLTALPQGTRTPHADGEWITDDVEAAFAAARQQGKPVFIDFTGYTCTNCRQMEANVFPDPQVAERFARDFVRLRLYTDDLAHGEAFQRYQLQLTGTVALPTYAIVSPERQLLGKVSGLQATEGFIAFLDRGTAAFQQHLAAR
jgi:thiol:disulfide interchange protein DsbD